MTVSSTRARHRSARRPVTPLTDLATAATGSIAVAGRRTAVVAASSGLVVSMIAMPASAATSTGDAASLPSVDTAALTASARAVLDTAPVVTAPADAAWTFEAPAVTAVVPEPEPVRVTTTATSRSTQRAAAATATATTETTAVEAVAAVPQSVSGNAVLEIAARYVGTPYLSGGTTPEGFDCSGFVSYVYAQLGVSLPRTSSGIKAAGTIISAAEAQPGDLIWSPGHISIYAGGDQQIDSPRPGKTIQFRSIWQSSPVFIRVG
ncbi:MAG TPA: NlpC/P60 family protein [Cellulomonas sp.]